jgi:hypothetical protein
VPLVTGLCRRSGNAGKLAMAKGLLRAVSALGPVCLLLDAWYRRGSLIRTALRLGHEVIGQVRRDTALFALPPPRQPGRRGRLYGARLDGDAVAALPASVHPIAGYGGRSARLRHAVCRPRFLKGVIVRGASWRRAPAECACCCPPIRRCPPPSRRIPTGGASSPCSAILRWSMAWGPCGNAGALLCCAGSTSFRSPALCWSC